MHIVLSLILIAAGVFPATSKSAWMQPEAFRLTVGMERKTALDQMKRLGLKETKSKEKGNISFIYDDQRTITLAFAEQRLQSIRFELVDFIPGVKSTFGECEKALTSKLGKARLRIDDKVLIYDENKPNVFVVASIDTATDVGKQGLGVLVVRYFDPDVK